MVFGMATNGGSVKRDPPYGASPAITCQGAMGFAQLSPSYGALRQLRASS